MEEDYDEVDAYIDSLIHAELSALISNEIGLCSCQFFKLDPEKGLLPFASGVMVQLSGSYYILTASHVIEDWSDSNKLFLEIQDGQHISVVGKGCGTISEEGERIDVAYIKLKDAIIPYLKAWYKFLPLKKILKHNKLLHEANYCVFGYPVANKRKKNGVLKPFGAAYWVSPNQDKVFSYYGLDPLRHYALEFKGKAVNLHTGKPEKIKAEYYGLSGGGLWYTDIKAYNGKFRSEARLIGIMIEFRKGKYECLIANRIELLLASLHKNEGISIKKGKVKNARLFPDLKRNI